MGGGRHRTLTYGRRETWSLEVNQDCPETLTREVSVAVLTEAQPKGWGGSWPSTINNTKMFFYEMKQNFSKSEKQMWAQGRMFVWFWLLKKAVAPQSRLALVILLPHSAFECKTCRLVAPHQAQGLFQRRENVEHTCTLMCKGLGLSRLQRTLLYKGA